MKTKYGWQKWSNGYINLYYLDDDQVSFLSAQMDGNIPKMVKYSVAEEDPESGIMKRTERGKEIFSHQIRDKNRLTNEIKRLNKNASNK